MDNISAVVEWGLVFSSFWVLLVFLLVFFWCCATEKNPEEHQKGDLRHAHYCH